MADDTHTSFRGLLRTKKPATTTVTPAPTPARRAPDEALVGVVLYRHHQAPPRLGSFQNVPSLAQRVLAYNRGKQPAVHNFARDVWCASPMTLIETERAGVSAQFLPDAAKEMDVPVARVFDWVGLAKSSAKRATSTGKVVSGASGQAALALARLLAQAQEIVGNSTAPEAIGFDASKWLGEWLELAQPALGGRRPSELISTPTGAEVVHRLLGALESGAYQ